MTGYYCSVHSLNEQKLPNFNGTGPYVIKERITDVTYKIKKENARSRSKVVHFNNLKPLKKLRRPTNKDDIEETPEKELAASDSEHEFVTGTVPNWSIHSHLTVHRKKKNGDVNLPTYAFKIPKHPEWRTWKAIATKSQDQTVQDRINDLYVSAEHRVGLGTMQWTFCYFK